MLRGNNYFFLERKGFWLEKCSTMFDELNFFFGIFIYGIFYSYLRILTCMKNRRKNENSLTNEASLKEKKKLLRSPAAPL